jgi:uncharacterized protein
MCAVSLRKEEALSPRIGELDAGQVRRILESQELGRVTCQGSRRSYVFPVSYTIAGIDGLVVEIHDEACEDLARQRAAVRFEVDVIDGPTRWSTVVAWGFFEEPPVARSRRHCIRLTHARGFHRNAADALHTTTAA